MLIRNRRLRNDRLVQIYVGQDASSNNAITQPYLVQETLLHGLSEYFVAATKHEHLGSGGAGVLRFPEDDKDAWELLLYWLFTKQIPHKVRGQAEETVSSLCLVNCWILADRYIIPKLQNAIMIEMIFRRETTNLPEEAARQALSAAPADSHLRRLAMEDLMAQVGGRALSVTGLERVLDGIPGTTGLLMSTSKWRVPIHECPWRLFHDSSAWMKYMVNTDAYLMDWPEKHWLWDKAHLKMEQAKSDARFPGR